MSWFLRVISVLAVICLCNLGACSKSEQTSDEEGQPTNETATESATEEQGSAGEESEHTTVGEPTTGTTAEPTVAESPTTEATGEQGAPAATEGCAPTELRAEVLANGQQMFNGLTLTESTPIADILANPEAFEGTLVQIEGQVAAVCENAGCWARLQDPQQNGLNLKVVDGVIDFRQTTTPGRYIVGEGIYSQTGHHGAQVFIGDHGAMSGNVTCPVW